jgi:hypothetical protein
VKDGAHFVTQGRDGAGVVELIDRMLAGELDGLLSRTHGEDRSSRHFKQLPNRPAGV